MYIRDRTVAALVPLLLGVLGLVNGSSWDLAVTVGNEIDFITRNGNLTDKMIITNASDLVGMAYDDDNITMFLSDAKNYNFSIFSVNLSEKNITFTPILKRGASEPPVLSMAFDSQTRTLYWMNERAIMRMYVPMPNEAPSKPVLVHEFDTEIPRGIALDVCNRHIYWVTNNRSNPSIMRSNFDGSKPTAIVTGNLYEPSSIVIDHIDSRIYWIDDEEGIHYKLERSNLDGSERIALVHGKNQQPMHLSVDNRSLYWTDFVYNAVWELSKDARLGTEPRNFKSFFDPNRQADLRSIVTRDNLGSAIDCKAMRANAARRTIASAISRPTSQSFINLTTNKSESCSNGGELKTSDKTCLCKPGYSGSRCEISSCHNYCLRGDCFVNDEGMPVCKCSVPYSGLRCEQDVCNGYCLNNGRCFVDNGKPSCECKYFSGVRCELTFDMAEICAIYCINRQLQITSIDTTSCRCAELNQTIEEVLSYDTFNCTILVSLLSGFIGMLTIIVVFLSVYVSKLRRRPRIKKRFVVNKNGITPLTSRPSQMSGDQCEITIENCCNMNICETVSPLFAK